MKVYDLYEAFSPDGIFSYLTHEFPWANDSIDELYKMRSGNKTLSPYVERLITSPTVNADIILTSLIKTNFKATWDRIYEAFTAEYDALTNYTMEETETPDITRSTMTESTGQSAANVYGFNSANPVPQANSSASTGQSGTDRETGTRKYDRKGLTGETPQQMIEREIALRRQTFYDTIFAQLDRLITCPMYE